MRKYVYLLFPLLWGISPLCAQEPKEVTPSAVHRLSSTVTRAVVVGISDYQSLQIPDLQFAHRDAEAFAAWLQSPAGGSVKQDNITLLTNEKATTAAIITSLFGLLDVCQRGDRVIFYFSGHGDVESKTRNQPGFLLSYDTPPTVYMAGAVNLRDLQEIVSTLSEKQVKMIMITDACHAGKLAGSTIGGTQATAYSLQQQFANEVKIMSCQPNELSLEGAQWGGGRGVFSWHLLDALTGLADADDDGVVSLFETGRYLEDRVSAETAPHSQMPLVAGDRQFRLTVVDAASLAALQESKAASLAALEKTGNKGLEDEILSRADSATRRRYRDFISAMENGRLLEPKDSCAGDLLTLLLQNEALKPLHRLMRRNLAVALLDEVQQALNALLDNDPYEADNWKYNPVKYLEYPKYLQRAMELLGEQHFMYRSLLAKKLYFEGYNLAKNIANFEKQPLVRDSLKTAAKAKYLESLRLEPSAAYVCYAVGSIDFLGIPISQTDSMLVWMQKAVDRSPSWLLPYLDAAEIINSNFNDVSRAESWLLKAKAYHPDSYLMMIRLAWLNQWKNDPEAANAICRELIARRPDLPEAWNTLAHTQLCLQNDWVEAQKSAEEASKLFPGCGLSTYLMALAHTNPDSAVRFCEKALHDDFSKSWLFFRFVSALNTLKRFEKAESWIEKFQRTHTGAYVEERMNIQTEKGRMRLMQRRLAEAETELQKSLDLAEGTVHLQCIKTLALLGEVKNRQGKPLEAEVYFKKALGYPRCWDQNFVKNEAHFLYGRFLVHQNRLAEAQIQFENALKISPKTWHYPLGMALLAAKKGQKTAALDWLEKALNSYYFDDTAIYDEPLFKKIRKTKLFKTLMGKHFPPGWEER